MIRKILALSLIVAVAWTTTWAAAPALAQTAPPTKPSYDEAMARLDRFTNLIEDLRSHLDRSQFDLRALLERLDYDTDNILEFVKNEIHFEQYPGLLRGAQGTLMSRAGNALDQSVLLATLLGDAGLETRIVRGRLAAIDAERLMGRMFLPRDPRSSIGDLQALDEIFTNAGVGDSRVSADGSNATRDPSLDLLTRQHQLKETAARTATDLHQRLQTAKVSLGGEDLHTVLLEESRDYSWVEYRQSASAPWRAVHPAFGEESPSEVKRIDTIKDSVPEDLQQRVSITVEIEQLFGGKLTRKAVMAPWERPIANLIGEEIRYTNLPNGLQKANGYGQPVEVANATDFFVPLLNGDLAPGAQLFDLNGVTAPPEVGSSAALGIFKQVGEKTESAANALSALGRDPAPSGESPDLRQLTGVWLTYTLIGPGDRTKTIRRTFFDALGDEKRLSGEVGSPTASDPVTTTWNLSQVVTMMFSPCDYPPAYVLDRTLEKISHLREVWQESLDTHYGEGGEIPSEGALKATTPSPGFYLFPAMTGAIENESNLASYQSSPAIVSTWHGISPDPTAPSLRSAVDIVSLGRRTMRLDASKPQSAVPESIRAGVWATYAEQLVPLPGRSAATKHIGAPQMLVDAEREGVELRVLQPADSSTVDSLAVHTSMRQDMKAALSDGYAVIAPARVSEGMSPGWWRVDPSTGETLGMGPGGLGADIPEALGLIAFTAAVYGSLATAAGVYYACVNFTECSPQECQNNAARAWGFGMTLAYAFALGGVGLAAVGVAHESVFTYEVITLVVDRGLEVYKVTKSFSCEP